MQFRLLPSAIDLEVAVLHFDLNDRSIDWIPDKLPALEAAANFDIQSTEDTHLACKEIEMRGHNLSMQPL